MKGKLYPAFQRSKVKRYLVVHGELFTFYRYGVNVYNEPTGERAVCAELVGMFYTQNNQKGFWLLEESDESRVRYKRYLTSFIIVDHYLFELSPVQLDDEVDVNGKLYRVTGTTNVQEANFAVNISLDAILPSGEYNENVL